jgi:hypothetical protein
MQILHISSQAARSLRNLTVVDRWFERVYWQLFIHYFSHHLCALFLVSAFG